MLFAFSSFFNFSSCNSNNFVQFVSLLIVGEPVGSADGSDEGIPVGNLVGRCVLKTPLIKGEEVVGTDVVGIAVGLLEG
jgi:hypothetical protein